jgi:hypothetical protein
MKDTTDNKVMRCPACKEISTFTHFYQAIGEYSAPVEILDGEVGIDYGGTEEESPLVPTNDGDQRCTCDTCETVVILGHIEIVDCETVETGK